MVISSTQTSDLVLLKRDVTSQFSSVNVPRSDLAAKLAKGAVYLLISAPRRFTSL